MIHSEICTLIASLKNRTFFGWGWRDVFPVRPDTRKYLFRKPTIAKISARICTTVSGVRAKFGFLTKTVLMISKSRQHRPFEKFNFFFEIYNKHAIRIDLHGIFQNPHASSIAKKSKTSRENRLGNLHRPFENVKFFYYRQSARDRHEFARLFPKFAQH